MTAPTTLVAPELSEDDSRETGIEVPRSVTSAQTTRESLPGSIDIHGSVVVVDSSGIEHTTESGFFYLTLPNGRRKGRLERVPVIRGQWSASIPKSAKFEVFQIELGGRRTVCDESSRSIEIQPDHHVNIRASWPKGTLLHVKAEDTGQELDQLEIVSVLGLEWEGSTDPGPQYSSKTLASLARSPVMTDSLGSIEVRGGQPATYAYKPGYYVRSPGYAWNRIEGNFVPSVEYDLTLKPGGTLDVSVEGQLPSGRTVELCVCQPDGSSAMLEILRPIERNGVIRLYSVAAGRHVVFAKALGFSDVHRIIGSVEVEVVAGAFVEARLVCE